MKTKDLILLFRRLVDDLEQPFLWSDPEALQYAHETQRDAAERAFLIEDDAKINVRADVSSYLLNENIIRVVRAKLDLQRTPLEAKTRARLDQLYSNWETNTGTPHSFVDEVDRLLISWVPIEDDILRMRVKRFPVDLTSLDQLLEIPARSQRQLRYGMAELAYQKNDSDAFSPDKSARNGAEFTRCFGIKREANIDRKQRERRSHVTKLDW